MGSITSPRHEAQGGGQAGRSAAPGKQSEAQVQVKGASLISWATISRGQQSARRLCMHLVQNFCVGGDFLEGPRGEMNPLRGQLSEAGVCHAPPLQVARMSVTVDVLLDSPELTTHSLRKARSRRRWITPSTTRGESSAWFCSGPPCTETSCKRTTWLWLSWRYAGSSLRGYTFVLQYTD